MDIAYVTKYTHGGLSGRFLQSDGGPSFERIFEILFDKGLDQLLSGNEAQRLYIQKMMIESKFDEIKLQPKTFNRKYVFSVGNPKFHKTIECSFIRSDFTNYRVPPEIEALGPDFVKEFQDFCEKNKQELQGKSEELFWLHVGAHFRLKINPAKVNYTNSGVQDIRGMTVNELKDLIFDGIKDCSAMVDHVEFGKSLKGVRYAPHRDKALLAVKDDDARRFVASFFDLKWNVMNNLLELYKKEAGSDGYILPVNLLLSAGVEPCKACMANRD